MATKAEVGGLTGHLNELTGEMHSELVDGDADFGRLRELAQEVAQRAESLAKIEFVKGDDRTAPVVMAVTVETR